MTDLRVCEQLQVVRQLVGQACGAKGAGARSLNLPVNSKWKKRNICTNLALTAPYTCHLHLQKSGLRSRQRFQALQDLSPFKRLHGETFLLTIRTVSWMWFQSLTTSSRTPGLSSGRFGKERFLRNSSLDPCFPRSIFST